MLRQRENRAFAGTAATGLALAATMLLTGCGGSAKAATPTGPSLAPALQGDPTQVVAAAGGKTVISANSGVSITVPVFAENNLTEVTGEGTADFPADKLKLIVPNAASNEERQFGRTVYVLLPEQAAAALGGKKWVSVDLDDTAAKSPDPLSLYAFDPRQLVTATTAISGAALVGTEDIRGTSTTHFHGELDPAKVSSAGLDPTFAKQLTAATKGAAVPMDVWLDDEGLVRRTTLAVPPPKATLPADAKPTATVELFDFNTADVSFAEPAASEVTDVSALSGLSGSGD